jgi:hypothetical protein
VIPQHYGLRFWRGHNEIQLTQIAGSGRIRLRNVRTGRVWWCSAPHDVWWEIYAANEGHTFADRDLAQKAMANLLGNRIASPIPECTG